MNEDELPELQVECDRLRTANAELRRDLRVYRRIARGIGRVGEGSSSVARASLRLAWAFVELGGVVFGEWYRREAGGDDW